MDFLFYSCNKFRHEIVGQVIKVGREVTKFKFLVWEALWAPVASVPTVHRAWKLTAQK